MQHADQLRNPGNALGRVRVRLMSPEDGTKRNRGNGASKGRTCGLKVPGPLAQEMPGCQQLLRMGFAWYMRVKTRKCGLVSLLKSLPWLDLNLMSVCFVSN